MALTAYSSIEPALAAHIQRVRSLPRLEREQEHALAVRARQGDEAASKELVESHLRYVVAVAMQYRRYGIPLAELIAEGSLGLMLAVARFDPDQGTRFVTYAGYWIRAYVLDLVVRSARIVGAGAGALRSKVFFRLRRERARLANGELDAEQQLTVLAEQFGVEPARMEVMLRQLEARDVSLNAAAHADSSVTLLDMMADETADQEAGAIAAERLRSVHGQVGRALGALDRRERYIVEQRLMGDSELSLAELGRRLGISRERARQLEARAKRKLRTQLEHPRVNDAA
jgi:RNA polymerase sigma-32 factor